MHRELQHKLKIKLDLENIESGEILNIDKNHTASIMKAILISSEQIENARKILFLIAKYSNEKEYENVAFNIEFGEAASYFQFKKLIKNIFKPHNIKVSLFLCKIIELTDISHIKGVLETYHLSPLGGHMSYERMLNSI